MSALRKEISMMNRNPIDTLFGVSNLEVRVTAETASAHNIRGTLWICRITQCDASGALLHVYTPINRDNLYLPWSSILSIVEPLVQ
jgi:hypothetical protein